MNQVKFLIVMILVGKICPLHSQNSSQDNAYQGTVTSKIYSNLNYQLNSPEPSTSFALTRAYFGYERQLSEHFSANIKLDVGSPEDLSEFSRISRYAYFKNAGIRYSNGPITAWGGIDEDDNSGILRYISIRHGGTNIGEGNEINGLTLGGVGRHTIVEYIEVISNEDDGFEIFGGTVNCKNLVAAFCGDDAFDIDQGYRGKCQFLLGINGPSSDKVLECSGGLQPMQLLPDAFPYFYNATFVGDSKNSSLALLDFNSYGAAHLKNSILIHTGMGIALSNSGIGSSYLSFKNGSLTIQNNEYYDPGDTVLNIYCYNEAGDPFPKENSILRDSLNGWNNIYTNSLGISENGLNLLPDDTVFEHLAPYDNSWYEDVSYKGAFGSENWIEGWTLLHEKGLSHLTF